MTHRSRTDSSDSTAAATPKKDLTSHADFEPYVTADVIASFIDESRRNVLRMAREGKLTCYPMAGYKRHKFKFKRSEVAKDLEKLRRPGGVGSEESPKAADTKK